MTDRSKTHESHDNASAISEAGNYSHESRISLDDHALADENVYVSERKMLLERKFQISSDLDRALLTFPLAVLAFAAPNLLSRVKVNWALLIFTVGCCLLLAAAMSTLKSMLESQKSYQWNIEKLDDDRRAHFEPDSRKFKADAEDRHHGRPEWWIRCAMWLVTIGIICLVVSLIGSGGAK